MPHLAADAINRLLRQVPHAATVKRALSATEVPQLASALEADTRGLIYSASLTFIEALNGINSGYFTWATVKLYYTAFYSIRALLGSNLIAVFYRPENGTPYSLRIANGSSPRKEKGVTHKVVWSIMNREFSASSLIGEINSQPAHEWLTALREEANYRNPRFPDPLVPAQLAEVSRVGLAKALSAYLNDSSLLYAFDPDHALIAFPLECLRRARRDAVANGLNSDVTDDQYLLTRLHETGCGAELLTTS